MIAELAAFGKVQPWPAVPVSEWQAELERQVQWLDTQQDILLLWLGRIEALLAHHWPELPSLLKLNSATLLRLLAHYGGPQGVTSVPKRSHGYVAGERPGCVAAKCRRFCPRREQRGGKHDAGDEADDAGLCP